MAFTMRTTKPEAGNKYYITKSNGGYSNAIKGKPTDKDCDVLANCVGYAYGRFNEIGGYGYCKYLAPVNAENFINFKGSCEVGMTPKTGACMVWKKGKTLSSSDGAGHVAIVEKVISETEVYTSESGWNSSKPFWNSTRKKGNGNWGAGEGYTFLGFIYNPAVKEEPKKEAEFKINDVVEFTGDKHYPSANSDSAKNCKPGKAKITAISKKAKHPYHLIKTANGGSTVYGWVDAKFIKTLETNTIKFNPYLVKVVVDDLRIRKGPGTNYPIVRSIVDEGTYTIVEEAKGLGSVKGWGRLKSGAGWISLDFVEKR